MSVTISHAATSRVLSVLGEELRPLTPPDQGLSVAVFDTSAPGEAPGAAGPRTTAFQLADRADAQPGPLGELLL